MKASYPKKTLATLDQTWFDAAHNALFNRGFTVADQIAKPISFTWNSDAPAFVKTAVTKRPLSVLVLGATRDSDPTATLSGLACAWTWDGKGSVRLVSIPLLTSSVDYTVTILVLV